MRTPARCHDAPRAGVPTCRGVSVCLASRPVAPPLLTPRAAAAAPALAPQGFAGGMGGGGGATERDIQEYNGVRAVGRAGGVSWEAFLSLSTEDNTERVLRGFASARLAARAFDVLVIQQLERKLRALSASSENDLASRRANLETHARRMCNFPEHFDAARDILHVTEVQQGARGLATSVYGLPAA